MTGNAGGTVRQNTAENRFELEVDGAIAFARYDLRDGVMVFTSTQTPPELRNRGVAGRLVEGALNAARAQGYKVVGQCSFVDAYLRRHPQFSDLVAT